MTEPFDKVSQEAAAFQKLCLETFARTIEAAFKFTPDSAPPETLRQIRAGILQNMAQSWEEFLRSPQFLDGMRQWMENAIAFRKIGNEFLGRVRNDLQAPSRSDIDTIMLAVRHMEKRVLDRLDQISAQIAGMEQARSTTPRAGATNAANSGRPKSANGAQKTRPIKSSQT
jgi:hypothetical protein